MEALTRNKTTASQAIEIENAHAHHLLPGQQHSAKYRQLLKQRRGLPVSAKRQEFLDVYQNNQVTILSSDTGSGKTTQIPQYVLFDEWGAKDKTIVCTQPRKLAAISVAARVAEELDVSVGETVGHSVRFDQKASAATRLKYATDGKMTQEAMTDPMFSRYSAIIVDEAHERTLPTDILLALLKSATRKRRDLRVVIMSATINASKFRDYFGNVGVIEITGRAYPVEKYFLSDPTPNYILCALHLVKHIHENMGPGDVLVFLPTIREIMQACAALSKELGNIKVLPLFATQGLGQQNEVFRSFDVRKVIIATNVAETSLTIDGVVYVIDSGVCKQAGYNPRAALDTLMTMPVSKASIQQRAGRAGRTKPGKCFALYTKEDHDRCFVPHSLPGILQQEMTTEILVLKAMGFHEVGKFDFIDPPHPEVYLRGLQELQILGMITEDGTITAQGKIAAKFPLHPAWYLAIKEGHFLNCCGDMLYLAAIHGTQDSLFLRPYDNRYAADASRHYSWNPLSDHITELNVLYAYMAVKRQGKVDMREWCFELFLNYRALEDAIHVHKRLFNQFEAEKPGFVTKQGKFGQDNLTNIRQALARSFFYRAAMHSDTMDSGIYITFNDNHPAGISPDSALVGENHEWVIYNTLIYRGRQYMSTVTAVDIAWIMDHPHFHDKNLARKRGENPAYRQPEVKARLDAARAAASRSIRRVEDPDTSNEANTEEWKQWSHPGRPTEDGDDRDNRKILKINDVWEADRPFKETAHWFARGVAISRQCDKLDWHAGQLVGNKPDVARASISHAEVFLHPTQSGVDLSSATFRAHIPRYPRPAIVGVGWGSHDLYLEWQLNGRHLKRDLVEKKTWNSDFFQQITFHTVDDNNGFVKIVSFLPLAGSFKALLPKKAPKALFELTPEKSATAANRGGRGNKRGGTRGQAARHRGSVR